MKEIKYFKNIRNALKENSRKLDIANYIALITLGFTSMIIGIIIGSMLGVIGFATWFFTAIFDTLLLFDEFSTTDNEQGGVSRILSLIELAVLDTILAPIQFVKNLFSKKDIIENKQEETLSFKTDLTQKNANENVKVLDKKQKFNKKKNLINTKEQKQNIALIEEKQENKNDNEMTM